MPIIWIIATGTEILQGHYTDRNSPWISARLHELGLETARHIALPDRSEKLREGLQLAAREADLVITTGGLGPTADDLNRNVIAEVWGTALEENAEAVERIEARFRRRGRTMTANNRVQALIPRGAQILQNENGTAPGFYLDVRNLKLAGEASVSPGTAPRARLLALPGPPREMQPMFANQAASLIAAQFAASVRKLRTLTLHTAGIPESQIDGTLRDLFGADPKVTVALLASLGHVQVRLTFAGADDAENAAMEQAWRQKVYDRIAQVNFYGEQEETLESAVGQILRNQSKTLALAESCTGGLIAARITSVPGSSDYFREGFVTYHNDAKTARLGVLAETLQTHGAVSRETAVAMAHGACVASGSDWALSITGIAGPGGGSEEKPVGLVFIGLAGPDGFEHVARHHYMGDRDAIRQQAAQGALEMLRRALLGLPLEVPRTLA